MKWRSSATANLTVSYYRLTIWYDDDTWHSFTDLSSSEMEFGLKTFRKIMRQLHARVNAITVHRYLTAHGTTHIKVEQSILRKETGKDGTEKEKSREG